MSKEPATSYTYTHAFMKARHIAGDNLNMGGYLWTPAAVPPPAVPKPAYTLKPLSNAKEIIDAVVAGKTIMRREDGMAIWWVEYFPRTNINIAALTEGHFAEQVPLPKTMVINGVEVPAPVKDGRWYVSLHDAEVFPSNRQDKVFRSKRYYWATKEDAEAVLAAMLKPFKELDHG